MEKPKVGQILYSLNVENAARGREQVLTPVKVVKVGRKYFTCKENGSPWKTQYHIDGWREKTDYPPNSKLYRNPQEWEDEKQSDTLLNGIRIAFRLWSGKKYTLDQLRRIKEIMEE